jgi:hypothetical protein
MTNETQTHEVYREVGRRSDDLLQAAVRFAERHPPLPSNQANGLLNVVNCEANINTILSNYIQHQAGKSTARHPAFWNELKRELEGLRKQAEEIQQKIGALPQEKKQQQQERNEIHLWLARDYVQHLVAHTIYRAALTGGK